MFYDSSINIINFLQKPNNEYKYKRLEKSVIFWNHFQYLINMISDMFEYKNLPDEIRPEFLEFYLNAEGGAGFGKADNEHYVACVGGRAGNVDPYGIGTYFTGAYPSGAYGNGTLKGRINKDVVFLQNNQTATPDPYIWKFAEQLTEIDVSLDVLIKNSRLAKVPIADTEQAKTAIEEAYKKIYTGVSVAVINKKPLEKMLNENTASYEMVDFTDVSSTDRIQHLLKAKEDIYRMFHLIYGHGTSGGYKLAQETRDEVNGNNGISFIYPNIKLKWRKKGVEQINEIFGLDISVDYSESWKVEHDEVLATSDDNEENVSRETIDETIEENVSRETIEEKGENENV